MESLVSKINGIQNFLSARKTLVFIIFIILPLAYLFFNFYFYALDINEEPIKQGNKSLIDQKLYKKVIDAFSQRELNLSEEPSKSYIDPFSR